MNQIIKSSNYLSRRKVKSWKRVKLLMKMANVVKKLNQNLCVDSTLEVEVDNLKFPF